MHDWAPSIVLLNLARRWWVLQDLKDLYCPLVYVALYCLSFLWFTVHWFRWLYIVYRFCGSLSIGFCGLLSTGFCGFYDVYGTVSVVHCPLVSVAIMWSVVSVAGCPLVSVAS